MPLPHATRPPLDERPGAVNFALAVWVGVVAAVIVSLGGFDTADPLRNAWVRMAALGASAGFLAWAFHTSSEWLARRLQLGVAVSLVLHTLGAIGVANITLETVADPYTEPEAPPVVDQPPAPVMALAPSNDAPQRPEFERPVETGEPDVASPEATFDRRETQVAAPTPDALDPLAVDTAVQPIDSSVDESSPTIAAATYERPQNETTPELATFDALEVETTQQATPVEPVAVAQPAIERQRDRVFSFSRPDAASAPLINRDTPAAARLAAPTPDATTPTIDRAATTRARSSGRSSRPPLVSVAPLDLGLPTPSPPTIENAARPQAKRPRTIVDARPARSLVDSIANLAAPAPRPESPTNVGDGPTSSPDALSEQTTPLPGRRPEVSPQGRRPPWVARVSGAPAPASLASPVGDLGDAANAPASAAGATLQAEMDRTARRRRRTTIASAPAAPIGSLLPATDREIGPGSGAAPPPAALATTMAQPAPRVAAATRSRSSLPSVLGAPAAAPVLPPAKRSPAPVFAERQRRQQQPPDESEGGAPPRTEKAIELGLRFLAGTQREDGRWSFADSFEVDGRAPSARADGAATGLALLAMLGAGRDHFDEQHGETVRLALDFLIENQRDDGLLFPELGRRFDNADVRGEVWQVARFYSHGVAAIALCEAFGMTGDAKLREPAQRALDYIEATQTPRRGGWRYTPMLNADLSVTGWQLMALRSGELAGLRVRPETYEAVRGFVESCRERSGQRVRFCYNPNAAPDDPRTSHGRRPGTVMTAVGLLSMLYLGDDPRAARIQLGANHLLDNLPTDQPSDAGVRVARISTIGNPLRDTYYWYYATQVMYHMGGKHWRAWNDSLHPLLVDAQQQEGDLAGSWDPHRPLPDRWSHFGGRHYVTTMNLLSLEVYYRHLPLYGRVSE